MKLQDAVVQVQGYSNWAVYATGTEPEAEARLGQTQFENGGLLDEMSFVISSEVASRAMLAYCDGDTDWFDQHGDPAEFVEWLNDEGWFS